MRNDEDFKRLEREIEKNREEIAVLQERIRKLTHREQTPSETAKPDDKAPAERGKAARNVSTAP